MHEDSELLDVQDDVELTENGRIDIPARMVENEDGYAVEKRRVYGFEYFVMYPMFFEPPWLDD